MLTPKNDLARLQRMASKADCRAVHWERALKPTTQRLDIPLSEAEQFVVATVVSLTTRDFVRHVEQGGVWFDVYACYREGLGWWVKIGEDDDGVIVMSHHAPEYGPETTISGQTVHEVQPVAGEPGEA